MGTARSRQPDHWLRARAKKSWNCAASERGQWEVRLKTGEHHLAIELKVPINVSLDQKQLSMAIPEAPSTFFELEVPRPVREVDIASGGWVSKTAVAGGPGTRLSATPLAKVATDPGLDRRGEFRDASAALAVGTG